MNFKEYMQSLPDDYLNKSYEECILFQDTGILPEGNVKELHSKWKLMYDDTIQVDVLEKYIFQEMARRLHNNSRSEGCECCVGDTALLWSYSDSAFIDNKGNILVHVLDHDTEFKVKYCPNCGRKF